MEKFVIPDNELVHKFVAGDQLALETLIERHKSKLYSYIVSLVKDTTLAEDVFQDTFIKVIRSLKKGNYKDDGKFISWVTRIAHNLVIDYFRKQKNYKEVMNNDSDMDMFNSINFSDITIEDSIVKEQIHSDLKNLVKLLPEEQRSIIIMRLYLNMSFKEIADHTDVSINTALGRMRYALINLKKLAEEQRISLYVN